MERHFDDDLNELKNNLLEMAALVEKSINQSIEALKKQDKKLAEAVIKEDEKIDEMELMNEEKAIELLALYQPMAIDLRYITMSIHITGELESIADMAVNISHRVINLAELPMLKPLVDIPKLSTIAQKMVKSAIDSFVNRNESLAKEVIESDRDADNLRNIIMKELIYDYMVKDGTTAPRAVPLLLVARDLERMCDHATAIAEDVIYMIRAKMVRHHPEKLQNDDK